MAVAYIVIVASIMFYGSKFAGPNHSIIVPIAMISLFTLSAAVMGYLFLYNPFELYMHGEKKNAVELFLKTVAMFAIITILALLALFLRVGA